MSKLSELQNKINEAEAAVSDLRKQFEAERKSERIQAIATAREIIRLHGLNAADLGVAGKAPARPAAGDKRTPVTPKYQDPASGKTWTGRGKSPTWLAHQIAAGRNKQDFLIKKA
jgi:DNA-binding protein H-NS